MEDKLKQCSCRCTETGSQALCLRQQEKAFEAVFKSIALADKPADYVLTLPEAKVALDAFGDEEKAQRAFADGAPFSQDGTQVNCNVFRDWWILDSKVQDLSTYLNGKSGSSVMLQEHNGLSARFRLPERADASKLTALFEGLLQDQEGMGDFAVVQSSLEQSFNEFARRAGQTNESA